MQFNCERYCQVTLIVVSGRKVWKPPKSHSTNPKWRMTSEGTWLHLKDANYREVHRTSGAPVQTHLSLIKTQIWHVRVCLQCTVCAKFQHDRYIIWPERWQLHRSTLWGIKRNQSSFVCISFNTWQKLVNFFICIKDCISYNSVYLILARVKNFVCIIMKLEL